MEVYIIQDAVIVLRLAIKIINFCLSPRGGPFSVYRKRLNPIASINPNALVYQYHVACRDVFPMPCDFPLPPSSYQCIGDNLGNTQRVLI